VSLARVWDKALAKSNLWLEQLGAELGWEDPNRVLLALRAVLHALRDRLPADEAIELSAQLPLLIRGLYFEGWDPSATPVRARSREAFFTMVRAPLRSAGLESWAERMTQAVFRLLTEHVSEGEIHDVRRALPAELADLWPQPAGSVLLQGGGRP
jgi:uncharacterized protein (DUF2267 family)